MKNNEKKVKELFSDEKKFKEFLADKNFMDKVSGGTATAQDYIGEFKKFDINLNLNLTRNEDEGISKKTDELLSIPVEKLDDETVSKVVGGISPATAGVIVDLGITALGGIPIGIAASSYATKAREATQKGNTEEAKRLMTNYQTLMYTMSGIIGAAGVVLGPAAGLTTYGLMK